MNTTAMLSPVVCTRILQTQSIFRLEGDTIHVLRWIVPPTDALRQSIREQKPEIVRLVNVARNPSDRREAIALLVGRLGKGADWLAEREPNRGDDPEYTRPLAAFVAMLEEYEWLDELEQEAAA